MKTVRNHMAHSFAKLLLFSCCLLLINCNNSNKFERHISFGEGWEEIEASTYKKMFEVKIKKDKLYILQFDSVEGIDEFRINDRILTGNLVEDNKVIYYLSNHLKDKNTIELRGKKRNATSAKLHRVNKLHIAEINLELQNKKKIVLEVKVKNSFDSEKQGTLVYHFYTDEGKKPKIKETPLFLDGNTESFYQQEFMVNANNLSSDNIKVECQLFFNNQLFDKDSKKWTNTELVMNSITR
jgi:hypothetical protein